MDRIDKEKFITSYEDRFGLLREDARPNMSILLALLVADDRIHDLRHAAYMLATVKHECADTWAPIEEYGKGAGKKYGRPDRLTGKIYYGRGYVQLTWSRNYLSVGNAIGVDLFRRPELALQYDTAYKIMSHGMRAGAFTGVGLNRYIHGDECDYVNARRIINGTDRAERIADYARVIEHALKESLA